MGYYVRGDFVLRVIDCWVDVEGGLLPACRKSCTVGRALQADGDDLLGLIDGVVFPESLKPRGYHLHAQQAVWDSVG